MAGDIDPFDADPIPMAKPVPNGVPFARPVSTAFPAVPSPGREILLEETPRLAALADVGVIIVVPVAFEIILASCLGIWDAPDDAIPEISKALLDTILPIRAAAIIAIVGLLLRHRRQSVRSIGLCRKGFAFDSLLGVCAMVLAYSLFGIWTVICFFFLPELAEQMNKNAERIMEMVPKHSLVGFVFLALVIGIYEELLFRGFLMTRLRRVTGSWTASVVITTGIFALLHLPDQELVALVPITVLSLVFSIVTIWRRSLVPAIVGHWLFNLSQFVILSYMAGDSWT